VRLYHPDYRVTWLDRVAELFDVRLPPTPPEGVDLSFLRRTEVREVRAFLDGVQNVSLLGDELVRCDSAWCPPEAGLLEATGHLVLRVRFGQILPGMLHMQIPMRWARLDPTPHGCRLLMRLIERPNPGLRSFLAGNFEEHDAPRWVEYAVADGG
jgi:hypothetical protein